MRTKTGRFCAIVLVAIPVIAFAQRTEVRVQSGTVVAETADANVAVEAGRRAVLSADAQPLVSVDNPFVADAMELYKLIEAEKAGSDQPIDSTFILVGSGDVDDIHCAMYFEFPHWGSAPLDSVTLNWGSAPLDSVTLPSVSTIPGLEVYDLNGNRLAVDVKPVNDSTASVTFHFKEPVPAGGHIKVIAVADMEDIPPIPGGAAAYYKEGPVWYFRTLNQVQNCLNYFRIILPPSAILLDATRQVVATDTVDGRLAVTMRNYTGEFSDGTCIIAFLWPEHDGTSLTDIPPKYLGLRDARDREIAETCERHLNRIEAGQRFYDRTTPVSALLSIYCAATHQAVEDYRNLMYYTSTEEEAKAYIEEVVYNASVMTLLEAPPWPGEAEDGYVQPLYLSRRGSLIHEFTLLLVYADGGWRACGMKWPVYKTPSEEVPDRLESARAQGYLTDWEVAGPYIQNGKTYADLFDIPFGPEKTGVEVPWRPIATETQGDYLAYVDLDRALCGGDQMVAYLRTTIQTPGARSARLELYTDDGVKAWLNGALIHANNVSRGISEPPDTVDVTLKQGANELLLKVTDDTGAWGAVVRLTPANPEVGEK